MRGDARVRLALPVEPLAERLDDDLTRREASEVVGIVRGLDMARQTVRRKRRGVELRQVGNGARRERAAASLYAGQIEKQRGDARVDEMRRDLRAHDACAEDGDATDDQRVRG